MQYRFGLSGNENKLEGGVKNLSRGVENKMRGKGTENKFFISDDPSSDCKKAEYVPPGTCKIIFVVSILHSPSPLVSTVWI